MKEITVEELSKKLNKGEKDQPFILDVRESFEYQISNIDGTLIPLKQLNDRLDEIEEYKETEVVVMCRSGGRSGQATRFLEAQGFEDVKNLKGGINQWAKTIDDSLPVY